MHNLARMVAFVWLASSASVPVWAASGYVYDAAGSVSVATGKNVPRPVVKNEAITSGTTIRTGTNSHAVLKFEDGQVVSMQADSTFQVRSYVYEPKQAEKNNIVFSMFKGGMRFITGQIGQLKPDAFRLATPNMTIGIRGTDFLVAMAGNSTYAQVLSGSISLTNASGTTILTAGQTGLTTSVTAATAPVPAASVPAGTFSEIAVIPVPPAVPAPVPPPVSGAVTGSTTATTAAETVATSTTAAGGAAAGGAAASTAAAAGGAATGISATTIGIGIGVAAVAVAVVNASTTQH